MNIFKNISFALFFMALGGLLTFFLSENNKHSNEEPQKAQASPKHFASKIPLKVNVVPAELREAEAFNEFPGTVQSPVSVGVMSQITGRILVLNATSGQKVQKGELLVQLDAEEIRTRIRQTESNFAAAQSNWASAKLDWLALSAKVDAAQATLIETQQDYERFQQLVKQNIEPRKRLEEAEARWKNAKSALESIEATVKAGAATIQTQEAIVARSQAQIDEAKAQLEYTEIRSPLDGIIVDKQVSSGDLATPGRQLLVLQQVTQLRLEASVSESCARRIRVGTPVFIQVDATKEPLEGSVNEIVPAIDPTTRSFLVRSNLPFREEFRPGMFGRLQFPCGKEKLLAVPPESLLERGQLDMLFVVKDQKAHLRIVRIGRRHPEFLEILSGVAPQELLILDPPDFLQEGDPVLVESSQGSAK